MRAPTITKLTAIRTSRAAAHLEREKARKAVIIRKLEDVPRLASWWRIVGPDAPLQGRLHVRNAAKGLGFAFYGA